jgi:nitroreductase
VNEILDGIGRRYSCRNYTKQPVAREHLEALGRAAAQAPSSRGNAPWHVAVVTDAGLIDEISDAALRLIARREPGAAEHFKGLGTNLFYGAPAVVVIATRDTHDLTSADLDAGLLVENVCLAATSLGLGSCVCGFATQAFRDPESGDPERLARRLGFPWGYRMTISVAIGHPAGPGTPHAPDLSKIHYVETPPV